MICDLSALIDRIRDGGKHAHFYCRLCSFHYRKKSVFLDHLKNDCVKRNPDFQKISMPTPNYKDKSKPIEPELLTNEKKGLTGPIYIAVCDLEANFAKSDNIEERLNNKEVLNEECRAVIASACLTSTMEFSCYDTPEIRGFKSHFFEPVITDGEFSTYDCIVALVKQSQTAKHHLDHICEFYSTIRLNDEERQIVRQTNHCMNDLCKKQLKESEKILDHCRVGSSSLLPGRGGGLRKILCNNCNVNYYRLNRHDFYIYLHAGSHFDFAFCLKSIAQAISCGDTRFRGVKLLCKASSERYLTFSFKFCCFDCLPTTKSHHSCKHSFSRYILRDSYAIVPSSLSHLIEVSAEGVLKGTKTFAECFPLYYEYLRKNKYLDYLTGSDLLTKGSMPYLSLESGEVGDKFLKSTEFIEQSEWLIDRFGHQVDDFSYNKCHHFWQNLQEYERKEKGRSLTWLEMFKVYCLSDTMFLLSILKKYILDTFEETGRNLCSFLSLPSFSLRVFMDVAKKEGQPVLSQYDASIYQLLERHIIGGVVQMNFSRINKTNAQFLPDYDPSKPSCYHMIIDQNSQYSNSMQNFSHAYSDFVINSKAEMRQACEDINNGSYHFWQENKVYSKKNIHGVEEDYIQFFIVSLKIDKKHQDKLKALPVVYVKKYPRKSWLSKNSRKSMNFMKTGKFVDDTNIDDLLESDKDIDACEQIENSYQMSQLRLIPTLGDVHNFAVNHR